MTRSTEVKYSLNDDEVRRERDQLRVEAGRLPGASADQAVGAA